MSATFSAPKGTYDLLPPTGDAVLALRAALAEPLRLAGYGYVETPTFEDTGLFEHGVGQSTDVVTKEMYTFTDRGGRSVTLRPEGTAGVVRAVLEAGLDRGPLPLKVWYSGAFYRYERPQAGRYRHFWQVGAEALGSDDPALDAEIVTLAVRAFAALGLRDVELMLNSLGDATCRPTYRAALQAYLRDLDLDRETAHRIEVNPLRVLDDKRPEVRERLVDAPLVVDHLCDACRAHHDAVRGFLTDVGVEWVDEPRLVRGLDYYTRTTFEFVHLRLGAQSSVGGGGRYDGLSEELGGPPLAGVGWALGVDRTLLALHAEGRTVDVPPACRVFAVPLGEPARTALFRLVTALRDVGVPADLAYGHRGLKGAMRAADRSGAALAVLAGERDLAEGVVQVKELATGTQRPVPLAEAVDVVQEML